MNNIKAEATITQNIGYEGKVSIKLFDTEANKQISTRIHNSGTVDLFRFFANCLSGKWNQAQSNCPARIVLFKQAEGEGTTFNSDYWDPNYAVSPDTGIKVSVPPTAEVDTKHNTCSALYHFRIPTSLIGNVNNIYKIGLYPDTVSTKYPLAYIFLSEPDQNILKSAAGNPNLVILLDWNLTLSNKTVLNNTSTDATGE